MHSLDQGLDYLFMSAVLNQGAVEPFGAMERSRVLPISKINWYLRVNCSYGCKNKEGFRESKKGWETLFYVI